MRMTTTKLINYASAAFGPRSRSAWTTLATLLRRAQVHDRKAVGRNWVNYPSDRFGWITVDPDKGCRFRGVGREPLRTAETVLVRVSLPFEGCGRDLSELVAKRLVLAYRKGRGKRKAA